MSKADISTIERAFELARSGACHSISDIRRQLGNERHDNVQAHLSGSSVQRQLKAALAARTLATAGTDEGEAD